MSQYLKSRAKIQWKEPKYSILYFASNEVLLMSKIKPFEGGLALESWSIRVIWGSWSSVSLFI